MKFQNVFSKLVRIGMLGLLIILIIFYIPKTRFFYNELPCLEVSEEITNSDAVMILPDAFDEENIICFWSNHQKLRVYLEDQEIYTTDTNAKTSFGKIISSGWNRIEIPAFSAGKELRVHNETEDIPFVQEYRYGTNEQINQWIHQKFGVPQLIDAGLVGIGTIFILFGISGSRKSMVRELPLYLGQAMTLFGMFFRVCFKGISIHWMNDYTKELICYISFYMLTIPLFMYISKKEKTARVYDGICEAIALLQTIIVLIAFTLHGIGMCDISRFIWIGIIFWILFVIWAVVGAIVMFAKRKNIITILMLLSAALVCLSVPLEFLRMYSGWEFIKEYGTILRTCVLLVVGVEVFCYSINIQSMEVQKERTEEENKKLQFQLLSSQIRPHFILNTLGAIRAMVMEDAPKASDFLYDFSMYLRKNIEEKDYMKPIPFGEELDYIETYLRLEQTRFGERLKVKYHIQEKEFWVLPLTIQPFVENAVKHGLFPKKNGGTLELYTYKKDGQVVIEIRDDGVGFEIENLPNILNEKRSVGLRSAIYRIESEMRGKCNITSKENNMEGTLVRVILPQ